jgi:hypothetical protein
MQISNADNSDLTSYLAQKTKLYRKIRINSRTTRKLRNLTSKARLKRKTLADVLSK